MIIRHNTIGSSAYKNNALKNVPEGRVPSVLFRGLNDEGEVEDFKGDPKETFKAMYARPKFPAVFAIGLWRDEHDFKRSDDEFVVEKARELQSQFNGKPIYFMPFLEHKLSAAHMQLTFGKIKAVAPDLLLVNNPMDGGEYVQGMLNELHYSAKPRGRKPPQRLMIYCFDGVNCADADFQGWRDLAAGCHMFSIWWDIYNQLIGDKVPRPERKGQPLPQHYEQAEYMLENPKKLTNFPKKELYKSNADRHSPRDSRADTPVFLLTTKKRQVVVKDRNGKKVFSAPYTSQYHDEEKWVYRPGTYKWPHEWAKQAVKQSGSSVCNVYLDGVHLGTIDLCYRDGYPYRKF